MELVVREAEFPHRPITVGVDPDVCISHQLPHVDTIAFLIDIQAGGGAAQVGICVYKRVLEAVGVHDLQNRGTIFR